MMLQRWHPPRGLFASEPQKRIYFDQKINTAILLSWAVIHSLVGTKGFNPDLYPLACRGTSSGSMQTPISVKSLWGGKGCMWEEVLRIVAGRGKRCGIVGVMRQNLPRRFANLPEQ